MRRKENEEAVDSCGRPAGAGYRDILHTVPFRVKKDFAVQAEALWQRLRLFVHSGEKGSAKLRPVLHGVMAAKS